MVLQFRLIFLSLLGPTTGLRLARTGTLPIKTNSPYVVPEVGPITQSWRTVRPQAEDRSVSFAKVNKVKRDVVANFLNHTILEKHANKKKEIIITFGNKARFDFLLNFALHLQRLKIKNYVIGAMDAATSQMCKVRGLPVFDAFVPESSQIVGADDKETGWGTKAFLAIGPLKVGIVKSALELGYTALLCDSDIAITRDPWPFFNKFPEADILTSSDSVHNSAKPGQLQGGAGSAFNIGYMMMKPSSAKLAAEWLNIVVTGSPWDQNVFNDLARMQADGKKEMKEVPNGPLFSSYNGTLLLGVLPVSHFCGGHTGFVQRMWEKVPGSETEGPYMIHTTFQYGGVEGKIHRLREFGLWLVDPPSYYNQPVVTYKHVVNAPQLGSLGQHCEKEQHFEIMNPQVSQIRDALALSMLLDRRLVLPNIVAGADRYWGSHGGVLPGSDLQLPFDRCPFDEVFNIEGQLFDGNLLDTDKHSGQARHQTKDLHVREYSLLENPKFHANGTMTPELPKEDASMDQWKVFLSQLRQAPPNARVLHFERLPNYKIVLDAFYPSNGNSEQTQQRAKFMQLFNHAGSLWCCGKPPNGKGAGHVHYDLFWDEPGHTDRFNRKFDSAWTPLFGP